MNFRPRFLFVDKKSLLLYNLTMKNDELTFCGFKPVFDDKSKVLVLGSFPSVKSRDEGFYYGNKQNRFWKILSEFYSTPLLCIDDKIRLCLDKHIALWDIVSSCKISGSMDSDIKDYSLVDLSVVLDDCNITKILCNGQKAFELTVKAYSGNIPIVKLPSTSPANVRFDKNVWFEVLGSI